MGQGGRAGECQQDHRYLCIRRVVTVPTHASRCPSPTMPAVNTRASELGHGINDVGLIFFPETKKKQAIFKPAFPKHATFILTAYIILLPHTNKMVSNDDVNSQLCILFCFNECCTSSAFPTHFSLANISSFFRFDGLLAWTLVFSLPQLFSVGYKSGLCQ